MAAKSEELRKRDRIIAELRHTSKCKQRMVTHWHGRFTSAKRTLELRAIVENQQGLHVHAKRKKRTLGLWKK